MPSENLPKTDSSSTLDVSSVAHFHGSSDFILTSSCDSTQYVSKRSKSCGQTCKDIFRMKTLYKRLPILTWLPHYTLDQGIGDFIAGLTVGMTVIPQGLAYAGVAGLASQYGLYGSFMGCFMYVIFGSGQYITIGSTAVASLLVFQTAAGVWQRAVLLTFLTGIIELIMAAFQLSFIVDFVSGPVSSGFTSAVALIVFTSQVKNIFGVKTEGSSFLDMWISIIKDIENIHWNDTIMGLSCIVFLISMKFIGAIKIGPKSDKDKNICQKIFNKIIWLLGISRNAIAVVVCIYIGFWSESTGNNYFKLAGYIPPGLPEVKLPDFSIPEIRSANGTIIQEGETFIEMVQFLGSGLIVIPLISLLESFAACKAFAKGQSIDVTQELMTVGFSNIANSLFQGYRANAGLARSAVNHASGARTPMSNFYIAIVVVLALLYLTPFFAYIPKACLAAIIISAVIFMVQYSVVKPMWRSKKTDLIPGFIAFIACLVLPLQIGILIGIGINMMFILYHSARPKIRLDKYVTSGNVEYLMLTPDRCLIFPSVEFVRSIINKQKRTSNLQIVIDCSYIYAADFTAAKVIGTLLDNFQSSNQNIYFYNLKPSVAHVFEGVRSDLPIYYNVEALESALHDAATPESDKNNGKTCV